MSDMYHIRSNGGRQPFYCGRHLVGIIVLHVRVKYYAPDNTQGAVHHTIFSHAQTWYS